MPNQLKLGDIAVDVLLKDIKNIHLGVYPPAGRVRISAPARMSLERIRLFAISKLPWIRQQQRKFREQDRETVREFVDRESHFFWGKRYLLKVMETDQAPSIGLKHREMLLMVRPKTEPERREALVSGWYRLQLKKATFPLLAKWEPLIGVKVNRVFVQRMKTKWGSCNPRKRSIRLNTELAKKPPECLEYVVVHEMAHFLAARHDDRFVALMDRLLPNWRHLRQVLNDSPLAHADWEY